MLSREKRRIKEKQEKGSEKPNAVEIKKKRHPFMWVLSVAILVLIVVAFIGAPMIGSFQRSQRLIFGYFNGEPIEYKPGNYFSRQRDALAENVQLQGNEQNIQWQLFQVWRGAFDRTVIHTAILQEARDSGLLISDDRIDSALASYPGYMRDGKFSPEVYRSTPNAERFQTRNLYHEELIHNQYLSDKIYRPVSSLTRDFFKSMASPERQFRYVIFSTSELPDEAVRDFGNENADLFRSRLLSRITMRNKNEAEAVLSQILESPVLFEELARNHSVDIFADRGGEMGKYHYYELLEDFADPGDAETVFNLETGQVSPLLESPYGWSFYRPNGPVEQADFSLEEDRYAVSKYMNMYELGKIQDYFVERGRNFISKAKADGFREAAGDFFLEVFTTDYFPINYGRLFFLKQVDGGQNGQLSGLNTNQGALTRLFALKEGELTDPIILGNTIVIAELVDEKDADSNFLEMIDLYYERITYDFREQEFGSRFLRSDKLEDNFFTVFSRYFLTE